MPSKHINSNNFEHTDHLNHQSFLNHYKTYAGMVYRASTCPSRFKSPKSFVTDSYVVSCRIELAHFGSNPVYGNGGTLIQLCRASHRALVTAHWEGPHEPNEQNLN
eukprot:scaffold3184_cov163-Skeletonema_dohrnii-CCMP3373.AAC.1